MLQYLAVEGVKPIEAMEQTVELDSREQRQLALQGEALEALEKTYGIWQSVKLHKTALVYSTLKSTFQNTSTYNDLVLAAYSCAATYVSNSSLVGRTAIDISSRATT